MKIIEMHRSKTFLAVFSFFLLAGMHFALAEYAQGDLHFSSLPVYSIVNVTNLIVIPNPVYAGSLADFTVTIENTGGVSTNFTANVSIYSPNSTFVENISFSQTAIGPSTLISLTKAWSTGSNAAGVYTASAIALYEQNGTDVSTNQFNTTFNISAQVPTPTPGGGGAGPQIPLPSPLPPKVEPVKGEIAFIKTTVLREMLAGSSAFEGFTIKNTGSTEKRVSISIEGLPAGWVSVKPDNSILLPNEERAVNLALTVPEKALSGDYLAKITVGDASGNSQEFMALRVKPLVSYSGQTVSRTVVIDRNTGDVTVTLRLRNIGSSVIPFITIIDELPSSLATKENQITFMDKNGAFDSSNGRLSIIWEFSDLNPRDLATISYKIKAGALDEYSTYFSWPVKQVVVSQKIGFEDLLRITDFHAPIMTAGKPVVVTAQAFYGGVDSLPMTADLEIPSGFKAVPDSVSKTVGPSGSANFQFEVTPPDTASGSYQISIRLRSDKGEISRSLVAIVERKQVEVLIPSGPGGVNLLWVFIGIIILLLVVLFFSLLRGGKDDRKEAEMRFKESEGRKDYLDQVKNVLFEREEK